MAWFRRAVSRRRPEPIPTRWTPDLWAAAFGVEGRFDATVIVRSMNVTGEWTYGNRRMTPAVEYRGTLDHPQGSALSQIPVTVGFDTNLIPSGSQHGSPETLGLVYTGAWGDERTGIAALSVLIWSDEPGAHAFEAAFLRSLAAGHDGLPIWCFAERKAGPMVDVPDFGVIQPVSRIQFRQSVHLPGSRPRAAQP